jgi:hypothetical protein
MDDIGYWTRELLHSGEAFTYDSLRDALVQDKKFQRQRKRNGKKEQEVQ